MCYYTKLKKESNKAVNSTCSVRQESEEPKWCRGWQMNQPKERFAQLAVSSSDEDFHWLCAAPIPLASNAFAWCIVVTCACAGACCCSSHVHGP